MAKESAQQKTEMKPAMEIYRKLGTPGAPHKTLSGIAGSWKARVRSWSEPGKPPEENDAHCEQRMILGGRFLQQEFSGSMMGGAYSGVGFTGYDNHAKKFISTWMDSMSTSIMFFEGKGSPDDKTFTQECSHEDPVRGPMKWRSITSIIDENSHMFEMFYVDRQGNAEKMMEITYTRKIL